MKLGKIINVLIPFFLLLGNIYAVVISNIHELDEAALFHFSIVSDTKGNDMGDPEIAKSDRYIKNPGGIPSEFVLGLGDHTKGSSTSYLDYISTDSYWKENFYPNVADGENETWGSGQGDWGAGRKIFNHVDDFWGRDNVVPNPDISPDGDGNVPCYYVFFEHSGVTVHVLSLHYSDSGPGLTEVSRSFMENKLNDFAALKAQEPGKHMVVVLGHSNGGDFVASANFSSARLKLLCETADFCCSATNHRWQKWDRYTQFGANAAVHWNSGSVSNPNVHAEDGYVDIHVFQNPLRFTIQYIRTKVDPDRILMRNMLYNTRAWVKEVDGPSYEADWDDFKTEPPGPPVSMKIISDKTALANDGSTATVTVMIKDANGITTPQATDPISVTVSQGGTIVGPSEGVPVDGKFTVQVSRESNSIRVTAVSGSLTASVDIAAVVNLVENPSFEIQGTGGEGDAAAWTEGPGHMRVTDKANTGSASLHSTSSSTHTFVTVPVEPGETYTIGGSIWNQSGGMAYIDMNDIGGEVSLEAPPNSSNWQKVSSVWTNSGNLSTITLRLVSDGGNSSTWFDDIQVLGPDEGGIVGLQNDKYTHRFHEGDIVISSMGTNRVIEFFNSKRARITLSLFDGQGKFIKNIYQGLAARGSHTIDFDTAPYQSGLYCVQGYAGRNKLVKKFVILR